MLKATTFCLLLVVLVALGEADKPERPRCPGRCASKGASRSPVCIRNAKTNVCTRLRACQLRERNCSLRWRGLPTQKATRPTRCARVKGSTGSARCAKTQEYRRRTRSRPSRSARTTRRSRKPRPSRRSRKPRPSRSARTTRRSRKPRRPRTTRRSRKPRPSRRPRPTRSTRRRRCLSRKCNRQRPNSCWRTKDGRNLWLARCDARQRNCVNRKNPKKQLTRTGSWRCRSPKRRPTKKPSH